MSATALAEVGWDGGFVIPVANAANKALEEEVSVLVGRQVRAADLSLSQLKRVNGEPWT